MKKIAFIVILLSLIVLIGVLVFIVGPHSGVDWDQPPFTWVRNEIDIGKALNMYKNDHNGHLPSKLSDLVPRYIALINTDCFFWPPSSRASPNLTNEGYLHEIDSNGTFIYLGERGIRENIILYERTNFWPQDQDALTVVTLTTNLDVELRSGKDVANHIFNINRETR